MNSLSKIKFIALNLFLSAMAFSVYAAPIANPLGAGTTFMGLIGKIANVMIAIGIPVTILYMVYAGFLFVTAQGSEEKVTKAKETLQWALIGAALLVGAKTIATALQSTVNALGGK
jgi:hypothetical protein